MKVMRMENWRNVGFMFDLAYNPIRFKKAVMEIVSADLRIILKSEYIRESHIRTLNFTIKKGKLKSFQGCGIHCTNKKAD